MNARIVALIALSACGGSDKDTVQTLEDYSYSFKANGCTTGSQKFDSLSSLCAGLQNESLNKGCAAPQRIEEFSKRACPGTFTTNEAAPAGPVVQSSPSPTPSATPDPTGTPEDQAARAIFGKGLFGGIHQWKIQNATFKVVKRLDVTGTVAVETAFRCSSRKPLVVEGNYPILSVGLGAMDCEAPTRKSKAAEILSFILSNQDEIRYRASHSPSSSEDNRFSLSLLDGPSYGSKAPIQDPTSSQSFMNEGHVHFNLVGKGRGIGSPQEYNLAMDLILDKQQPGQGEWVVIFKLKEFPYVTTVEMTASLED